ncbi:MAG TPA: hypothetical protein VG982_03250 [Candidatus Paceibacterota bacterium]|nr:hypothetical protein [Candidatus Paceibacterota bacterium]
MKKILLTNTHLIRQKAGIKFKEECGVIVNQIQKEVSCFRIQVKHRTFLMNDTSGDFLFTNIVLMSLKKKQCVLIQISCDTVIRVFGYVLEQPVRKYSNVVASKLFLFNQPVKEQFGKVNPIELFDRIHEYVRFIDEPSVLRVG